MENVKRAKIKIGNPFLGGYLIYILCIWGTEVIDLFCYLVGLPQTTILSRIIVLLAIIVWFGCMYKRVELGSWKVTKSAICGMGIILVIGLLKSVYPDVGYDTTNYHLIAQRPGYTNYFEAHFAKGHFQVWGFRLGDRLFWSIRNVLGYRYGTLLNTFILMILYLQVKQLLDCLKVKKDEESIALKGILNNKWIWSLIIVFSFDLLAMIGTYYVDVLALPIAVEVLVQLLKSMEKTPSEKEIFYYAFLNGIWLAFKMTNIVFVMPCVLIYIWINRKALNGKVFGISVLMAGIPCSVYLMFNYICTKNPVFPYFNEIFKSPFCLMSNIKDLRWGGTNFIEKMTWLFSVVFRPEYRVSELPNWNTFVYVLGIIGMLGVFIKSIIRIVKKDFVIGSVDVLTVILLSSAVLWGFSTGYGRYFMLGYVLLGGLAYYLICVFLQKKVYLIICWVIFLGGVLTAGTNTVYFMEGRGWSWNEWKADTFELQIKKVFRDKRFKDEYLDVDMFYLTDNVYGGIAEIINSQAFTVNTNYRDYLPQKELLDNILEDNEILYVGEVYDIRELNINKLKGYVSVANEHGLCIKDIKSCVTDAGNYALIKLNKEEEYENYCVKLIDDIQMKVEKDMEQAVCEFLCGKNTLNDVKQQKHKLQLTIFHEGVVQKTFEVVLEEEVSRYEIKLENVYKDDVVKIEIYDTADSGNLKERDSYFIMNARIIEEKY